MPRRAVASATLGVLLLLCPASAAADDAREQSRAAFMRGVADAHVGHYTAARDAFLEAYTLFAHPSILLNLGIARWHTGEYIQAEKDLARFLSDDGGASDEDITNARSGLAAVRQHLGTVRIRITPDRAIARLDEQPVPIVPGAFAEVRAVVGPSVLRAEAEGYTPIQKTLIVGHDSPTTLDVALVARPADASRGRSPPPGQDRTRTYVAYGAFGLAAASTVGWIACAARTQTLANDYNDRGSAQYQDPGTKSTGLAFRTGSDVLFVTALAAGGAGAFLLLYPFKAEPAKSGATFFVGPAAAGVAGTF